MSEEALVSPFEEYPIVQRESIRYTDLDLRKEAKRLAKKEETRLSRQLASSKSQAIKTARKRISFLEREVDKLGQSKAELLGYASEIANLQALLRRLQDQNEEMLQERDFILINLLSQKNAPATEQKAIPKAKKITAGTVLENIWFLRSFLVGAVLLGAGTLLAYSLYFRAFFETFGSAISYFPWSWDATIANAGAAADTYSLGIGVSLILIGICLVGLLFFIPEMFRTMVEDSVNASQETPN
jgi:hypothetical protein